MILSVPLWGLALLLLLLFVYMVVKNAKNNINHWFGRHHVERGYDPF